MLSKLENICLLEGSVLLKVIFQVEKHRDLELQMCKDFLILEFKICRDLRLQIRRDIEIQMSRDLVTASNAQT